MVHLHLDHSELNLPVGCELFFPNAENLLAFKLDLTPTEVSRGRVQNGILALTLIRVCMLEPRPASHSLLGRITRTTRQKLNAKLRYRRVVLHEEAISCVLLSQSR